MTDSYTALQAAKVLGISERRVRQLAVERVLNVVSDKPLKLGMESVHVERERRRYRHARLSPRICSWQSRNWHRRKWRPRSVMLSLSHRLKPLDYVLSSTPGVAA